MGRIVAAVLFLLLLPASALGQDQPTADTATSTATVSRDPSALALLAQCGGAMGGGSIQDTSATGTLTSADTSAPPASITLQSKGAAERFDVSSPDESKTSVLNEGRSWAVRQGKRERVSYALSAYHRPEHVPALACLLDFAKTNMSFAYLGTQDVRGRSAHHVKIFVPSSENDRTETLLSQLDIFLDAQTLVVLKTERFVFDPQAFENRSVWATYYSDYRVVGAALMPYHIENYLDGHKVRDIAFSNVQVNAGVSDSQFQADSQVQ